MQMIGKLGEDEKANWPGHLTEIVHAYVTHMKFREFQGFQINLAM